MSAQEGDSAISGEPDRALPMDRRRRWGKTVQFAQMVTAPGRPNSMKRLRVARKLSAATIALSTAVIVLGASPAFAARKPENDPAPPSVAIASPAAGATVSGTVTVSGTAADNVALSKVEVAVDGGAWQLASGKTAWSWGLNTTSYSNGPHTLAARATDT